MQAEGGEMTVDFDAEWVQDTLRGFNLGDLNKLDGGEFLVPTEHCFEFRRLGFKFMENPRRIGIGKHVYEVMSVDRSAVAQETDAEAASAMRKDDIRRAEIFNRAFKPKVVK